MSHPFIGHECFEMPWTIERPCSTELYEDGFEEVDVVIEVFYDTANGFEIVHTVCEKLTADELQAVNDDQRFAVRAEEIFRYDLA